MTLTTHALVGAAVISLMPSHPALGATLAFSSHLIIDAIPHYDYHIHSSAVNPSIGAKIKFDKALALDALYIGFDALAGLLLAYILFHRLNMPGLILLGAFLGMLPDPLQFVYAHFKHEPLSSLQRLHEWIHAETRLEKYPERKFESIASQVLIAFLFVFTALLIHRYFL